jgi:hypothetical protein
MFPITGDPTDQPWRNVTRVVLSWQALGFELFTFLVQQADESRWVVEAPAA